MGLNNFDIELCLNLSFGNNYIIILLGNASRKSNRTSSLVSAYKLCLESAFPSKETLACYSKVSL